MAQRYVLLAATAAALVSAQAPPRGEVIQGCTTNSFAIPSWYIQEVAADTASQNVTFNLLNRAYNYTADLACYVGNTAATVLCAVQDKAPAIDFPVVSLQLNGTSAHISINQTWICNDRNENNPLTFTAVGSNTIALTCTGQACEAVNKPHLVKGSLISPVAITPVYAEGPTGHDAPGCSAGAKNPTWKLSNIYFEDLRVNTNESVGSPNFGSLLTNPSNGYEASCIVGSSIGTGLACAGTEFGALGAGRYRLTTSALFDPATFRFTVNQTWFCDDGNPSKPVRITASASEILDLKCANERTETPDVTAWTCVTDTDVTLKGKLDSETPLPPYSIEDPVPSPDSCTLSSILNPRWTFSDFTVESGVNDNSSASVGFEIILQTRNPGFQYPIAIIQDARVANSSWYRCDIGPEGDIGTPLWPVDCSLSYTPATKELSLQADWKCTDLDPEHPILCSGFTTTTINSTLECTTVDNKSQCVTTDTGYSWSAPISNVTWRPAPPKPVVLF